MKLANLAALLLCGLWLAGCGDPKPVQQPGEQQPGEQQPIASDPAALQSAGGDAREPVETDPPAAAPEGPQHYGAPFALETPAIALAEALPRVDEMLGSPVKVAGTVKTSCRKKGCWMQLQPIAEGEPAMRVTFKDYGFFVPLHSDGAEAVIEGEFVRQTMDEATRRHFAEDAGQSPEEIEAIVGDVEVIAFVATGVHLTGLQTPEE